MANESTLDNLLIGWNASKSILFHGTLEEFNGLSESEKKSVTVAEIQHKDGITQAIAVVFLERLKAQMQENEAGAIARARLSP